MPMHAMQLSNAGTVAKQFKYQRRRCGPTYVDGEGGKEGE